MTAFNRSTPGYVLGNSDVEFERLITQARFFGELTEDILKRAGLGPGMRVLDVGCGVGDVSLLAAALVGPSGSVLGVDRSSEAIARARDRLAKTGLQNVRFVEAELNSLEVVEQFDALIGRFVLLYLPDPAATLRRLCGTLRPGGIVAFHEMDMNTARSLPLVPLFQTCVEWIRETFVRGGIELDMGSNLFSTFYRAGLPQPQMLLQGRVEGSFDSPAYAYVTQTLQSVLPMAERLGVTTADDAQIETFADRLREQVVGSGAVLVLPSVVGAWTRLPQ